MQTIVVRLGRAPDKPLSTNEANTMHWAQRAKRLDPWKEAGFYCAKEQKVVEQVAGRPAWVQLVIPFRTNHRRDPSNYVGTVVKATVDGMVRAGVWPDDSPQWVEILEPVCRIGETAGVIIEIKP